MKRFVRCLLGSFVFSIIILAGISAEGASPKPKISGLSPLLQLNVGAACDIKTDFVVTGIPIPNLSVSPSSQNGISVVVSDMQTTDTTTLNAKLHITGTPTATGNFSFTLTAANSKGSDSAAITVAVNNPAVIPVTAITLVPSHLPSLHPGETSLLSYTITPASATNKLVTWNSDNPAAAAVDGTGRITAVARGSANITVTTQDGGFAASLRLQVNNAGGHYDPVTGITLNLSNMNLNVGDTRLLSVSITPADATNQNITWSTSDASVAAVTANGLVAALSPGTATITAAAADGPSASCVVTVSPVTVPVNGVIVVPSSLSVYTGTTALLAYTISPLNASNKAASWSSNNTTVATVDPNGLVSALTPGSATITVTTQDGGKIATCAVTVLPAVVPDIPVAHVSLSPSSWTLNAGDTKHLLATITPPTASNQAVSWSTGNPSIATVSVNGMVTGISAGTTTITVTTQDGDRQDSCTVTVLNAGPNIISVIGIALADSVLQLERGATAMPAYTITPPDATNKLVSWSSDDPSIATVDNDDGLITAVSAGSAVITVTTQEGGRTATCRVNVSNATPNRISVTGITVIPEILSLDVGTTRLLSMTITPANATDQEMYWSSDNGTVASVTDDGVVTALSPGTATIIATTRDGGKTDTCVVTVNPITVPVSSISVVPASLTMQVNGTAFLSYTIDPTTASNKLVSWSSSNSGVAMVDPTGLVTAKAAGTATITATTQDGGKQDSCAITVGSVAVPRIPVSGVAVSPSAVSLNVGGTKLLVVGITPANATNQNMAFSTSNAAVAAVTTDGLIVALSPGTATITVTEQDSVVQSSSAGSAEIVRGSAVQSTCIVTINPLAQTRIPLSGITISAPTANLTLGNPLRLTPGFNPSNASNRIIYWSSSNTNVAIVDSNGLVTPIGPGTAIITATSQDGSFQEFCVVTVTAPNDNTPVRGIQVYPPDLALDIGANRMLMYTITPTSASDKNVIWSSSNPDIATVDETGLVTAKAFGYTLITATTEDGGYVDTCSVVVSPNAHTPVPLRGISVYPSDLKLNTGETRLLVVDFDPDNATDQALSYLSSNTNVAIADVNGLTGALSAGTADVTVTAHDGNKQAASHVTVVDKPQHDGDGGGSDGGCNMAGFGLAVSSLGLLALKRR